MFSALRALHINRPTTLSILFALPRSESAQGVGGLNIQTPFPSWERLFDNPNPAGSYFLESLHWQPNPRNSKRFVAEF